MSQGLVIAGCLSGELGDRGVASLVDELVRAVGADVTVRARTGGSPCGTTLPEALEDLSQQGVRRALVVTTHVCAGRLQRGCADACRDARPDFDDLRLAAPLLSGEGDPSLVAAALDEALPARPGRVIALAGHRGEECAAAFARLGRALSAAGRDDVLVGTTGDVLSRAPGRRERAVLLGPLLMALGHHARHDVLGGLAAELAAAGLAVAPWPHALAELPAIRAIVVAHALAALE